MEPPFHQYAVLTLNGQVLSGIIESRTATSIHMALSDGSRRQIPLDEIESMKDTGISLMPEGIEAAISPEQLSDLLDYARNRN